MKHLTTLLLTLLVLGGCVTSAFGLDPYSNLNDETRVNLSYSELNEIELEKCIHINWAKRQPKFPLITTYNENGKVLAFVGALESRFFAIEITENKIENFLTKMRVSITSDPTVSMKRSVIRKDLIEVLLMCGEKQSWTTLN